MGAASSDTRGLNRAPYSLCASSLALAETLDHPAEVDLILREDGRRRKRVGEP